MSIEGTVKTQGTHLYFVHRLQSDPALVKMDCPTGITGIGGGAKDTIDTTCLDTIGDRQSVTGLGTPSAISAPFNFIRTSGAQQALVALKVSGEVVPWILLMSDGDAVPTLDTDGAIVAPAGDVRSSIEFSASVSECTFDFATNEIVRGTLSLLRSGSETYHFATPA